jgi:peptidoglycan/xylan/chitin deacetylase (PgdA/CDA1 family)
MQRDVPAYHGRYDYSPIVDRPPLRWPGDARLAIWVIPNIEHFHFDKPGPTISPPLPGQMPDVLNYSWRDFGPRVGVWRTMRTLDRHNIRGTVALNAEAAIAYPEIIREGKRRGWEFMGHGMTNSQPLAGLDEAQERAVIAETISTIEQAVGQRPRGWLGPRLAETVRTPDLLAEAGIDYVCDWVNDEQPYEMRVRSGRLLALPYSAETNDIFILMAKHQSARDFGDILVDQFDVLWRDAEETGLVMAVSLHPFLCGVPYRDKYLDLALAHMRRHPGVWFATGSEIADHYRSATSGRTA